MEYSDSEDMASQQLLAEVQASAKKALRLPTSSAVQSAALLNAARVTAQPPSSPSHVPDTLEGERPAIMDGGRVNGGGKLKRPSLLHNDLAKRPKPNLARRGDPFEIQSSPEKGPAKASAQARRKSKKSSVHDDPQAPEALPHPPGQELNQVVDAISPTLVETNEEDHVPLKMPSSLEEVKSPVQKRTRQRKPTDQEVKSSRRSKSPRVEAVARGEIDAVEDQPESTHQDQRDKPVKQRPGRRAKTPKLATEHVVHDAGGQAEDDQKQSHSDDKNAEDEENTEDQQQKPEHEPPQSAQKPPEQFLEFTQPQKPRRGKMRALNALRVSNGLDIASDKEDPVNRPIERERGPASPEIPRLREKRRRPPIALLDKYGKLPRDQTPEPVQESDPDPEPTRRQGRVTRASKKLLDEREALPTQQEHVEPPTQVRRSPQKTKKKAIALVTRSRPVPDYDTVSVPVAQSRRARGGMVKENVNHGASDEEEELSDLDEPSKTTNSNIIHDDSANAAAEQEEVEDEQAEQEQVEEGQTEDEHGDAEQDGEDDSGSDIQKVFNFLHSDERTGRCQTSDAIAITEACKVAREVFQDNETTADEILTTTRNLQQLLTRYGNDADASRRRKLKSDAYAYLFRRTIQHLKGLYDWLRENNGEVETSFDALRIVVPFITSIISFKDRIADWKVELGNRYKGDGLIKDVVRNVIVPLRRVEIDLRATLRSIREAAEQQRAHEKALRAIREREEAAQRKHEFEELKRKKQVFWIDLHVCRLQVEHDPHRQQALAMKQKYFDEQMARYTNDTDANGMEFERVDVFKKRVAPPARPSAFLDQKEWTDEQMAALVEGLTQFSGPYVFHHIFKRYCGYGRPLRRYGVPEITAKAAEVRGQLLETYQEQAWEEIPGWITKIPVLP